MAPPALASSNFNSFISSAIWLAELTVLIHVEPSWGVIFLLADHQTMPVRHPLSSRSLLGGALLKWSVVLSFVGKIMGGTGNFRADFSIISISVVYATLHTVQMKDLFLLLPPLPRTSQELNVCCMTNCAFPRRFFGGWFGTRNCGMHFGRTRRGIFELRSCNLVFPQQLLLFLQELVKISTFYKSKDAQDTCNLGIAIFTLHHQPLYLSRFCH